ncbi:MAG TPA: hypothetical protein VHD63_11710 [Ktedonobacteraceae bacterium]|nr:hypothetical protein [Ktedonobacteraceae bacterium]
MATYFFSGVNKPELVRVLEEKGACGMLNALSAGEPKLREAYLNLYPNVEFTLDSGAVQGNQNVARYARLLKSIGPRMQWVSSLDRLHDQQSSQEQYEELQRLLADAPIVSQKVLWIYQTQSRGNHWHPDGDLELLKRAVERYRFIGLGGLVSVIERDIMRAQDLLEDIGKILDAADAQAHAFGIGNFSLLTSCLTRKWFRSADSARWLQGLRSRTMLARDGTTMSGKKLSFTGLQIAAQNVESMLAWMESNRHQLYLLPQSDPPVADEEPVQLR